MSTLFKFYYVNNNSNKNKHKITKNILNYSMATLTSFIRLYGYITQKCIQLNSKKVVANKVT